MTVSTDRLIVDVADGIGRLVFNQPEKHNAISADMWQGIAHAMHGFAEDDSLRVVVLSGAGDKAFSAGADISEFEEKRATPEAVDAYDRTTFEAVESIVHFDRPTIAMIQGYCVGGGAELALCCDLRIASEDARFGIPAARAVLHSRGIRANIRTPGGSGRWQRTERGRSPRRGRRPPHRRTKG